MISDAIDANQLSGERLHCCNCLVDPLPLCVEIGIKLADDYSRVLRLLLMQSHKVQPIQREHSPIFMYGNAKTSTSGTA